MILTVITGALILFLLWDYLRPDRPQDHTRKLHYTKKLLSYVYGPQHTIQNEAPSILSFLRVTTNSVQLTCQFPRELESNEHFQVQYRSVGGDNDWEIYPEEFRSPPFELKQLKTMAKYQFQVRTVAKGPYSPVSYEIMTLTSAAAQLAPFCVEMKEGTPPILKVPMTEVATGRNDNLKTRKFVIGEERADVVEEKTVILVGAVGTNRDSLVNEIVNFILGVNWEDQFRFSVVDMENEDSADQAEWITCYSMYPVLGSKLQYKLNIVTTPGFGDTGGQQRDREIVAQIRKLFDDSGDQGINFVNAVCFLAASDDQQTATQTYILNSILSLFGKDFKKNICTFKSLVDDQDPTLSGLPLENVFVFDNPALYASNSASDDTDPLFWQKGSDSYMRFFDHLTTLRKQGLVLTETVLEERDSLEKKVMNLQPEIAVALSKIEAMKQEIIIIERHRADIEANKDFEYEIEERVQVVTEKPKGTHVTNCISCYRTCHDNCKLADNKEKKDCVAMKSDGFCKECESASKTCHWTQHKNTGVVYSFKTVKMKIKFKDKYQQEKGVALSPKLLLDKIIKNIEQQEKCILQSMEIVNEWNNKLKEIALNANPLTVIQHIELMIEAEKQERRPGYEGRIDALNECKKHTK